MKTKIFLLLVLSILGLSGIALSYQSDCEPNCDACDQPNPPCECTDTCPDPCEIDPTLPECNPSCGDGTCDQSENCSCAADCGEGDGTCNSCGDGTCDLNTERCSCEADCGNGGGACESCGDGICNLSTELCSCPADCGQGDGSCPKPKPCAQKIIFYCPTIPIEQFNCKAQLNLACPLENCVPSLASCPVTTSFTTYTSFTAATQCLKKVNGLTVVFPSMPDFTNMVKFNKDYPLCSNGGIFYYVSSSIQDVNGGLSQTFSGLCSNGVSIDSNTNRCTYIIQGAIVDPPETTTSSTVLDGITSLTVNNSTNTNTTSGTVLDGITSLTVNNSTNTSTTGGTVLDGFTSLTINNNTGTTDGSDSSGTGGGRSYSISGVITGAGTILPGLDVEVVSVDNPDVITTVTTDSNGQYVVSGLKVGGYLVRPVVVDDNYPYIFYSAKKAEISTSDVQLNLNGLKAADIPPNIAEMLKRGELSSGTGDSSLNDWINQLTNGDGDNNNGGTGSDDISAGGLSNAGGNSFNNIFSENSLMSLLNKGYLPLANSYSPIGLSLLQKYANQNAICGNSIIEEGEGCDDGVDNGKTNHCSSDCLYFGEVRFTNYEGSSSVLGNGNTGTTGTSSFSGSIVSKFQIAGNIVSAGVSGAFDILEAAINQTLESINDAQEWAKQKIIENTSPRTRKIMKQTAIVAEEVAKYSVIGVVSLLGALAASLHVMVYKSQWATYTVQEGDTIDSIGNKFTMTDRALKGKNGHLKKGGLRPGMKIHVKNRHFIEKDYLDQLRSVLKDGLEKRHYGRMAGKIDKMFAKK